MLVRGGAATGEHGHALLVNQLNAQAFRRALDHQAVLQLGQLGNVLQRLAQLKLRVDEAGLLILKGLRGGGRFTQRIKRAIFLAGIIGAAGVCGR